MRKGEEREEDEEVKEKKRKRKRELQYRRATVNSARALEAYWDADKVPGHFYRQTTYFHPPIAWED